jgi:ribosome-binding factor A
MTRGAGSNVREEVAVPGRRQDSHAHAPYPRTARVNQVVREVLADALERLADTDERLRLATVTAVDTAPDLRHATVFMSSLTDDMAEALGQYRVALQRAIAREVRLKRTPHLEFAPDPAVAHGTRVEEILRRIRRDDPDASEAPPVPPGADTPGEDDAD